jgi:cob(I)alamin adenosyltransferase
MKIYTRTGDRGETTLLGGERVRKSDARVEAFGTVDELNACIGMAIALESDGLLDAERMRSIQNDLFTIGARLAAADPESAARKGRIPILDTAKRVRELEEWIDELDDELPELTSFILPGGSRLGGQLHACRTVCRRSERAIARLGASQPELDQIVLPYMNRLSDLLFTLARYCNAKAGQPEDPWRPTRQDDE